MNTKEQTESFSDTKESATLGHIRKDNSTALLETNMNSKKTELKKTSESFINNNNQNTVINFLTNTTLNFQSSQILPSNSIEKSSFILQKSENSLISYDSGSFEFSEESILYEYQSKSTSKIEGDKYEDAVHQKILTAFSIPPENIVRNFSYNNLEIDFVIHNTQELFYDNNIEDSKDRFYRLDKNKFVRYNKFSLKADSLIIIEAKKSSYNSSKALDQLLKDYDFLKNGINFKKEIPEGNEKFAKIKSFLTNNTIRHYYFMIFTNGEASDLIILFNYEKLPNIRDLNESIQTFCCYMPSPDKELEDLRKAQENLNNMQQKMEEKIKHELQIDMEKIKIKERESESMQKEMEERIKNERRERESMQREMEEKIKIKESMQNEMEEKIREMEEKIKIKESMQNEMEEKIKNERRERESMQKKMEEILLNLQKEIQILKMKENEKEAALIEVKESKEKD